MKKSNATPSPCLNAKNPVTCISEVSLATRVQTQLPAGMTELNSF